MKIHADLRDVIPILLNGEVGCHSEWLEFARGLDKKYPAVLSEYYNSDKPLNPYVFFKEFSEFWDEGELVVVANGSCCVSNFQAMVVKKDQRIFGNSGCASMGYGLPAAVGACFNDLNKRVVCLEGDGSIQMNLQELQTAVHHNLNLKIVWVNNEGYHSIRQTQTNNFNGNFCGVSKDNGISFPSAEKIANAYGIKFFKVEKISDITEQSKKFLACEGVAIMEAVVDKTQFFAPKLSSKMMPDGKMMSPEIEDMYPFIDEQELKEIMSYGK